MDPRKFDGMIQQLSQALSRRSLVGGSLGAAVMAGLGLGDEAQARKVRNDGAATAEACIPSGKKCPSPKPRGKQGKTLNCNNCCEDFSVTYRNRKGKRVRKCACKPVGQPATTTQQSQCCSGVSDGAVCISPSGAAPPPVCPPSCTAPKTCCSGTCCESVHACNAAGGCATCADVCAANCDFCYNLAEGRTICGDGGGTSGQECVSSARCPETHPYCVLSLTYRAGNLTVPPCSPVPAGAGCCYRIPACST